MRLKRVNVILVVILVGAFLLPKRLYAGILTVKEISCCMVSQSNNNHPSCKNDCAGSSKSENGHCKDECRNQLCQNCLHGLHFILSAIKINQNSFNLENVKLYNLYKKFSYTPIYLSVWKPPKLG